MVSAINTFKDKYQRLWAYPHQFAISYYYVSKGEIKTINSGVNRQCERVQEKASQLFPKAKVSFTFVGAAQLLDMINRQPQRSWPLEYSEIISPKSQRAWACLVPISSYYKFITNEDGEMKNEFFEGNVRDWEGDEGVNAEIRNTLEHDQGEDFWWLNNGITILARDASDHGGHELSIEAPQIVNGLQTSRSIYNYFRDKGEPTNETRNVLIRIIAAQQEESSDHIIKATNSQTQVPPFRLHMTEKIHRNIETSLRNHGLYYDRRKNFYKNQGKPITRIVQPLALAQTIMSVVLQKPDDARGRPNTVIDNSYNAIFSIQYPLTLYPTCALLIRKINTFLSAPELGITRTARGDLRWYLAMQYSRTLTEKDKPTPDELANMNLPQDENLLRHSYELVNSAYKALGATHEIAKGTELLKKVGKTFL